MLYQFYNKKKKKTNAKVMKEFDVKEISRHIPPSTFSRQFILYEGIN